MSISEIKDWENFFTPDAVEILKKEVELFLKKAEANQTEVLSERSKRVFSPASLEIFFRKKERNEKINQILQCMIAFLDRMPGTAEDKPIDPIEQFRECVRYEVALLLEEDVKKAVFNEINQVGSLNGDNVWDFLGKIIEKNRELTELIVTGASDVSSTFFTLCLVLEHLSLFWFDVKQGDVFRIRRSDIYIYKLARVLQSQYQQTEKP